MTKMSENSVVLLFSDSSNRPNKLLLKWMMHCKWGTSTCVLVYTCVGRYTRGTWAYADAVTDANADNMQ